MFSLASLIAALTIASAFWVGILVARRLRDWGDGRRLPEAHEPLALAAAGGGNHTPPQDPASQRVRARVAQRLEGRLYQAAPRALAPGPSEPDISLLELRQGDVVIIDAADRERDGDYIIEGVVTLREGAATSVIIVMADGDRRRWLVASPELESWLFLEQITGHGLFGEPPRHIQRGDHSFTLGRRGQASAAGVGMHGRPALPRVATYLYQSPDRALWLERWGDQVLMGEGGSLAAHFVSFLPGT
ncbi:MAG: DUF4178 domain-containing protein [Nannocystis sp.]|jgi:hypothetical protein|nr:DUF4178 domain-containing protein [Nannocystis sp.]